MEKEQQLLTDNLIGTTGKTCVLIIYFYLREHEVSSMGLFGYYILYDDVYLGFDLGEYAIRYECVVLYLYLNEFLIESMIYNLNIIYVFIPNVGQNKVSRLGSHFKDAFLVYLDACHAFLAYLDACHPDLLIIQTYLRFKSDLIEIIRGEYLAKLSEVKEGLSLRNFW